MTLALGTAPAGSGVERIAALLAREAGLTWSVARQIDLSRAVREHAERLTGGSEERLAALVESDRGCLDDLVADVTVGETYFFRDPAQFRALTSEILPGLVSRYGPALRAWSAGCATGEEAYSLAIALAEAGVDGTFPVLGTDISRTALRRAESGAYGQWSFRGEAEELRDRYFEAAGMVRRPTEQLRQRVRFEWLNLAAPTYPSVSSGIVGMHVIFCRNVLIYLTPGAVASVARRLHDALAPGGWLVAGASDPGLAEHAPFELVFSRDQRLLYRRSDGATVGNAIAMPSSEHRPPPTRPRTVHVMPSTKPSRPTAPVDPPARAIRPTVPAGDLVAAVRALADAGKHTAAEDLVAASLDTMPFSAELHYLSAIILLERGRPLPAAAAARRACYLDPDLVVAGIALGAALRHTGDLRGARRAYRRVRAQLVLRADTDLVALADGERVGGLRRSVESCIALVDRP